MLENARRHIRGAAIVVVLALVFTFLGIYGTNQVPFIYGFGMWLLTISVGAISSLWISPMVFEKEPSASWPAPVQIVLAALVISLPVTVAILVLEASDGVGTPLWAWPIQFAYVFVISLLITIGGYFLQSHDEARALQENGLLAEGVEDPTAKFMERLPPKYRGAQLYAVSSEDHYLRIHTSLGEELILMRLADAVDLLAGAKGLQVHRSWWVAEAGVEAGQRVNGKPVLKLKSGGEAPVSRTYQKSVREAGLI